MYTHCKIEPSVGLDANTTFTILALYGLRGTSFAVRQTRKTPDSAMSIILPRYVELDSSWSRACYSNGHTLRSKASSREHVADLSKGTWRTRSRGISIIHGVGDRAMKRYVKPSHFIHSLVTWYSFQFFTGDPLL